MNRYPESESELKGLLAAKYGLKPQNVLIGNGSNEMIETALRALKLDGRTEVLVTEPSFAFYRIAATIYGYDVASVPLDSLRLDLRRVAEAINEKTRVIFLCNPNNPTGTIFDDEAFAAFLASLPPEVLVVVDEAYAEFADSSLFPRSVSYIDRYPVLVLRTFSKAYGLAGLRVGYGIAEESLVSFLERTKQPFSVNMMALIAARAALSDERHLAFRAREQPERKGILLRRPENARAGCASVRGKFRPYQDRTRCGSPDPRGSSRKKSWCGGSAATGWGST